MANSYYEELQKRRAAEEAARKEAAKGYRQAVEAGKNAKSQRENPAVTTTEYTQRQRRAKQAADLFLELTHPVKSNPYLMATANEGMAREQAAKAEEKYTAFMNEDSEDSPAAQVTQGPQIQHQAQQLQEETERWNAEADYWKNQKGLAADQAITERNMKAINAWSEEDRATLETYIDAKKAWSEATDRGTSMEKMDEMSEAWNQLAAKYGEERLKELVESYERNESAEATRRARELAEKHATGFLGKTASSVGSVGANLVGSITAPLGYLEEMVRGTGQYQTLDPNNVGNLPNVYSGAVRGKVSGDLERQGTAGKVGSVVYQGAMSAADSLARLAVAGEAGSLALAGLGSFGQTVSDVSAKGGNKYQAIGMGVVTAGLEVATEKVSLDNLLTKSKGGYQGAWNAVKDAFVQAGVEVSEEEISFIGSTLAEAAILREKSDYHQRIGDLVAGGMSYQEAKEEANRGLINEALQTAAVSAVSGGLMSGGASVVNKLTGNAAQPEAARNMEPAPVEGASEVGAEASQEAQTETEAEMKRRTTIEAVREVTGGKSPGQQKEVISIEDYANNKSPVWRNVEYADDATKNSIMQETHSKMVEEGKIVTVSGEVLDSVSQSYPDLRSMKKKERTPILKASLAALKKNLRQFLGQLGNQTFEFEVNDKVLEAKLYSTGIDEVLEKVTQEKADMLYTSGEIFRNAQYLYSTPDYDGDPNVYRWNYFYTPVQIGENTVGVRIAVRDVVQGQNHLPESQIYNWGIKKDAPLGGAQPVVSDSSRDASSGVSNNTISETAGNVNRSGANPESSVGAAKKGFTGKESYYDLLTDENSQPDRPGDVRPMEVPKTDAYGRRVSEFTANAYGAEVTPDAMASRIEELVADGALGFDTRTNKQSLESAAADIQKRGMASTRNQITNAIASGKLQDGDIEKAMLLYSTYASRKSQSAQDNAAEMMVDLATMANMTGRNLQLFKLLRKMTPDGQLMTVQKNVDRYVDQLNSRRSGKHQAEVIIPQEMMEQYRSAAEADLTEQTADTARAKDEIEQAIYKVTASQIKATPMEKLNAWRYMAMLGNAKTQVRNVLGNAAFKPYVATKRAVGAVMERMFVEQDNRTKSILGFGKDAGALKKWAAEDARSADTEKLFSYSAQTGDMARGQIEDNRAIFDTKALEEVRKFIQAVPEGADMVFKRWEYSTSLASFLKARGFTAADLEGGKVAENVLNEAREYAAQEALKATFNDQNSVSDFLSKRYRGDNWFGKAMNLLAEGVLPFRRTPANILVRAVEYSPAGIGRSIYNLATKVRSGEMSASTAIDQMAAGLTGTGAMVMGYALASGLFGVKLVGHLDDEDEKNAGRQAYSIEIGDKSFTIDWAAPANIPLFVGANFHNALKDRDADAGWFVSVVDASVNSLEPMLELSCLSSLNDLVESARYAEEGTVFYTLIAQGATSYLNQLIPTLFGQIEQAAEGEKKQVYSDADTALERSIETTIGRATQKIPGVDLFQAQKYDNWGRPVETSSAAEALVSPSYSSEISTDPVDAEILRLNKVQDENVTIDKPSKTITYTDVSGQVHKNRRLTAQQWETMQRVYGQTAKGILDSLIGSGDYEALSDSQKAEAFNLVYDYAREKARSEAVDGYAGGGESWMEGIDGQEGAAIIRKVATAAIGDAFDAMTQDWKNGGDGADGAADLEAAYGMLQKLDGGTREAIRENASGRVGDFLTAVDAGVDAKTFAGLYQTYYSINTGDAKAAKKANDWAYQLQRAKERGDITAAQLRALKSAMTISSGFTAEAEKFDAMAEAGIRAEKADYVTDLIAAIKPQKGYADVRDIQKAEKIAHTTGLTESERATVMKIYMPAAQDKNLDEMLDLGYSVRDYVTVWQLYDSGKGDGKKARTIAAIREELGCDYNTAKAIYEIYG